MSWVRLDDGFEDNPKVAMLSDGAHRLWLRALCWSMKPENRHFEGLVPRELLQWISRGVPKARLRRQVHELVSANAFGSKSNGLWVEVEAGYQFHDWAEFLPATERPAATKDTPANRSEAARIAGLRSAEARRARSGTAQPTRQPPNDSRTTPERDSERLPNDSPERTPERSRTIPRTPVPVPVPNSEQTTPPKTVRYPETPNAPNGSGQEPNDRLPAGPIPCPPDLELEQGQVDNLVIAGVPRWATRQLTVQLRAKACADPDDRKPLGQWRKYFAAAIRRIWSDPRQRPVRRVSDAEWEAKARERDAEWERYAQKRRAELADQATRYTPEEQELARKLTEALAQGGTGEFLQVYKQATSPGAA